MTARIVAGLCITLAVTVAASTACTSEELSCPAVVSWPGPVLNIVEVTGPGGTPVRSVEVASLRLDGRPALAQLVGGFKYGHTWTPGQSISSSDIYWNVRRSRGRLLCDVPCGFGTFHAEDAELGVVSDGARGTWRGPVRYRSTEAEGDDSDQGCGSGDGKGVDVEIDLRRPSAPASAPRSGTGRARTAGRPG